MTDHAEAKKLVAEMEDRHRLVGPPPGGGVSEESIIAAYVRALEAERDDLKRMLADAHAELTDWARPLLAMMACAESTEDMFAAHRQRLNQGDNDGK